LEPDRRHLQLQGSEIAFQRIMLPMEETSGRPRSILIFQTMRIGRPLAGGSINAPWAEGLHRQTRPSEMEIRKEM
jgi:hypothetical protein